MTFPSADILASPGRNDHIKNAASPLRYPPPSTAITTASPLPSRRSQTLNKSPRPRKISMTASVGSGGEGLTPAKRSDMPTEFYIPVELYLSSRASVGPRKVCPPLPHKPHPPSRQIFHDRIRFSPGHSSLPISLLPSPVFLGIPAHSPPVRRAWMVVSKVCLDPPPLFPRSSNHLQSLF